MMHRTLGVFLIALISTPIAEAADLNGSRPNLVLLMTDDQGKGDLRCLGNPNMKTPNLDKLYLLGIPRSSNACEQLMIDGGKKYRSLMVNETASNSPSKPFWVECRKQKSETGIPDWTPPEIVKSD